MDPARFDRLARLAAAPARRRELLAAALLAAAPAAPSPEAAGKRRKRKPLTRAVVAQVQFAVPPGAALASGTAVCPKGQRAVGGGVVQSGADVLRVLASGPRSDGGPVAPNVAPDRWFAAVANTTDQPVAARVFALCSGSTDVFAAVWSRTLAAGGGGGEVSTGCPDGSRALGGGVLPDDPAFAQVLASGPLDASGTTLETGDGDAATQWYGAGRHFGEAPSGLEVVALCSRKSRATVEATQFTVQPGQVGADYAVCPGAKRAIGGGLVQSGNDLNAALLASGPLDASGFTLQTDDGDKATQWYAAVMNLSGNPRTFRVFAICE